MIYRYLQHIKTLMLFYLLNIEKKQLYRRQKNLWIWNLFYIHQKIFLSIKNSLSHYRGQSLLESGLHLLILLYKSLYWNLMAETIIL